MPRASHTRIINTPLFGDCDDCVLDAGDEGTGDELTGVDAFSPEPDNAGLGLELTGLLEL